MQYNVGELTNELLHIDFFQMPIKKLCQQVDRM